MAGEFLSITQLTPTSEARQKKQRRTKRSKPGNPDMVKGQPNPPALRARAMEARKSHYAKSLAELVRTIGSEVVDEATGLTRLELLIKKIYADALAGKTAAAEIILERGWGKVPAPVELDISGEIHQLVKSTGITLEEINSDPMLRSLLETSGVVIEGAFEAIEAPSETEENGRKLAETDPGQDQTGANRAESQGNPIEES